MKEKKLRDKALIKEIYQAMISNKLEEFIDNHEINYSYAHLVQNYADKIGKKNFAFNKYFKSYSFNLKRKIIKNIESFDEKYHPIYNQLYIIYFAQLLKENKPLEAWEDINRYELIAFNIEPNTQSYQWLFSQEKFDWHKKYLINKINQKTQKLEPQETNLIRYFLYNNLQMSFRTPFHLIKDEQEKKQGYPTLKNVLLAFSASVLSEQLSVKTLNEIKENLLDNNYDDELAIWLEKEILDLNIKKSPLNTKAKIKI